MTHNSSLIVLFSLTITHKIRGCDHCALTRIFGNLTPFYSQRAEPIATFLKRKGAANRKGCHLLDLLIFPLATPGIFFWVLGYNTISTHSLDTPFPAPPMAPL